MKDPIRAFTRLVAVASSCCVAACGDPSGAPPRASSAAPQAVDVPILDVPHAGAEGAELAIDGVLSEAVWTRAADTGAFVDVARGGASARDVVQGRARLLYDDAHLYVGIEVADPKIRGGFPAGAVDPHLWERDTTEIMVDPHGDGDNLDYYEIQIGPQNLVFDSRFDAYNAPRGGPGGPFGHQDWRADLTSAVHLDGTLDDDSDRDQGYVVEAKIPWTAFGKARVTPPRAGDEWRMNFYAMEDNGGTAWSPILGQGNFHKASRFGRVRFGPKP